LTLIVIRLSKFVTGALKLLTKLWHSYCNRESYEKQKLVSRKYLEGLQQLVFLRRGSCRLGSLGRLNGSPNRWIGLIMRITVVTACISTWQIAELERRGYIVTVIIR
jgi:hypothetical protein